MNGKGPETRVRGGGITIAGFVMSLAGTSTRGICDQVGGAGRRMLLLGAGAGNCWGRLNCVGLLPVA